MAVLSYEEVMAMQRKFYNSGATRPLEFRKKQLRKLRRLIEEERELIEKAVYKDLRRNPGITNYLEIGPSLTEIDHFLENLDKWAKPEKVAKTVATMLDTPMVVSEPYGVVFVITTWNFPALMYFYPMICVLAAGNTMIIKGSELSEATTNYLAKLINNLFPPEYVTVFTGGPEVSTELLKLPFDKIMYTGNPPVGRIVMEAAAKHLTPVVLELGGKCPVVVVNDADIKITAKRIIWAKFTNAGQICITVDYVIVTADVADQLIEEMKHFLTEFYGENPQKSADYGRIINQRHFDRLKSLLDKTLGKVHASPGHADRADLYIPPTIVEVEAFDILMSDEIFGPILPVLVVKSYEDALQYIKSAPPPLAAYVFSKNQKKTDKFIAQIQCGSIVVNDLLLQYGLDTLPFGGFGTAGMGVYRGKHGFDEFSHKKSVLQRGFFGDQIAAARYPPYTEKKFKQLAFLSKRRNYPPAFCKYLRPSFFGILLGVLLTLLIQKLVSSYHISFPLWSNASSI
ncbi:unnamed protein product [Bursaphelenchus xylophilus]|uniref:Aldehyde dehydrogenase n=1 Tax=Bursaphelenchus xylophilus TaxID=6326 RepID=A0A1I7RXY0_BURXY|nr:unnamed protein product [Bursaphelenchus xylophilus]CAG9125243.1 unnamed protein product [Bursaphelenchus xylophilus]